MTIDCDISAVRLIRLRRYDACCLGSPKNKWVRILIETEDGPEIKLRCCEISDTSRIEIIDETKGDNAIWLR